MGIKGSVTNAFHLQLRVRIICHRPPFTFYLPIAILWDSLKDLRDRNAGLKELIWRHGFPMEFLRTHAKSTTSVMTVVVRLDAIATLVSVSIFGIPAQNILVALNAED